jgi:hypothetical protein
MKTKKIPIVKLGNDLLFNLPDSKIYFNAIYVASFDLAEKIKIYRDKKLFDSGCVQMYGTHGSFPYLSGMKKIFPSKEETTRKCLLSSLFKEGDEILLQDYQLMTQSLNLWAEDEESCKTDEKGNKILDLIIT